MVNALKKLKANEFTVSPDLSKNVFNTRCVSFNKKKLALIGGYQEEKITVPGTEKIYNYYRINGRHFVSLQGYINELVNGTLNQISSKKITGLIHYLPVMYKGKEEIYFFNDSDGFLTGGETPQKYIPPFDFCDVFDGRIFFAKKNRLNFSRDFNLQESSFDLRADYYIDLKKKYGQICGIKRLKDKLYVFCEKIILSVTRDNSSLGLKIEETELNDLKIRNLSVALNNGQITFINDGRVCRFDGKNITELDVYISKEEDSLVEPKTYGKYYMKNVKESFSALCILFVDVEDNSQHRFPVYQDLIFSQEEGGGINLENRKIVSFSPETMPYLNGYFSSNTIKLCDGNWVAVVGVSAKIKGQCTMSIRNGYNEISYEISEDNNDIKCFQISNNISLTFKDFSLGFELQDLKIKLRKRK